jgi:hypothetical protein
MGWKTTGRLLAAAASPVRRSAGLIVGGSAWRPGSGGGGGRRAARPPAFRCEDEAAPSPSAVELGALRREQASGSEWPEPRLQPVDPLRWDLFV